MTTSQAFVENQTVNHLERHELELDVLAAISALLAKQTGQRRMLSQVLDHLEQRLGMECTTIMLASPDGTELIVEATRSAPLDGKSVQRYRRGEGIIGTVLQTGRPAIIPQIGREPRFQNRIHHRAAGASHDTGFLCVPIVLDSEVVGTLSADIPKCNAWPLEEHARALGIVASLIAFDVKTRKLAELERHNLELENERLRSALQERFRPDNMIGNSNAMDAVYQRIHQVAGTDTSVMIRGESGTGKELVAAAIHYSGKRAAMPFVKVNCAALNESLLESELFGHEKGAFTGAVTSRPGRVEEAEGGTLFLDEVGDFSLMTQVKLLRVLQEREYERVGSNRTLRANVRIMAATNRDLEAAVKAGEFRQDLYYRINVFPMHLPPLRDRKDDILLLADHFANKYGEKMGKKIRRISTTAINMMFAYHWPGNVRELENCIEYAVLLTQDEVIHGQSMPPTLQMPESNGRENINSLTARVKLLEHDMIVDALKATGGNVAAAARMLSITSRIIRYKIKNLGIDPQHVCEQRT